MADSPPAADHPRWGLSLARYPELYTNDAISARMGVPLNLAESLAVRISARIIIGDICELANFVPGAADLDNTGVDITLDKLKHVLDLTRFPYDYGQFAEPKLAVGCIKLMASVGPSPFACEYGYLCFRLMAIALTTLLLDRGPNLNIIAESVGSASPKDYLQRFWDVVPRFLLMAMTDNSRLAELLSVPPQRLWTTPPITKPNLNILLNVLHNDQKNFLTMLEKTRSLGLSGLMFILWKYVASEIKCMDDDIFIKTILAPYCRIFYRYQLMTPNFQLEYRVIGKICHQLLMPGRFPEDKESTSLEDSRKVMGEYTDFLKSNPHARCEDAVSLLKWVGSLFIPGCEDLIPGMLGAALESFWSCLPDYSPISLIKTLNEFVIIFGNHLEELEIPPVDDSSWTARLGDTLIDCDMVELMLRTMLFTAEWEEKTDEEVKSRIELLIHTAWAYKYMLSLVPRQYAIKRLDESGELCEWWKCMHYLKSNFIIHATNNAFHWIVVEFFKEIFSDQWEEELAVLGIAPGFCENPRCPAPAGVVYIFSNTSGSFCSARCLAVTWVYAPLRFLEKPCELSGCSLLP